VRQRDGREGICFSMALEVFDIGPSAGSKISGYETENEYIEAYSLTIHFLTYLLALVIIVFYSYKDTLVYCSHFDQ